MTSSVTDNFKRHLLNEFKNEIDGSDVQYYMGLARSDNFVVGEDQSSLYFQSQLRHTMQSVKILSSNSFVVPHIPWSSGVSYSQYDEADLNTNFYVVNSSNEVFVCIQTGKVADGTIRPSTVEPTSGSLASSFKTSDGYIWRQVAMLSNVAISNFLTSDWMPIKTIVDQSPNLSIPQDSDQRDLQNLAVPGEIINLAIDSGGTGYTTAPTITITGNGSSASFTCNINAGKIVRINIDSDDNGIISHGSGYDYASVVLSDGDAVIRPVIGSPDGINADPIKTLKAKSLMVQADFVGSENNTIQANSEFNQMFLLKDPKQYGSSSAFVGNTGNALKSFTVSSVIGDWNDNNMMFSDLAGGTKKGKVFYYSGNTLYYYQDEETGFNSFETGAIVSVNNAGITATVDAIINPDIDAYSGDILYINNINTDLTSNETLGITRVSTQTEDTKVIIQLG